MRQSTPFKRRGEQGSMCFWQDSYSGIASRWNGKTIHALSENSEFLIQNAELPGKVPRNFFFIWISPDCEVQAFFFKFNSSEEKKKKVSGGKISTDVSSSRVVRGLPLPEERGNSQRERNKSFWKKKTPARRYFPYHFNHKIARMRSVPACYPNVDLNTTERWFENFHFCNLLSFVKPRLERNLAAVCKSGTISLPTHSVGGDVEGTAQERREREGGGLRGARPPPGPAEGARAASQPGGWLHLQESEGTRSGSLCRRGNQSGGLGQLLENFPASRNGVWGAGGKESGGRDRHHQLHSGMSDPAQGLVLREEKRLHASRITHDGFRA